jgi:arabinan endo-1,5-alpha-L-arabinosidase
MDLNSVLVARNELHLCRCCVRANVSPMAMSSQERGVALHWLLCMALTTAACTGTTPAESPSNTSAGAPQSSAGAAGNPGTSGLGGMLTSAGAGGSPTTGSGGAIDFGGAPPDCMLGIGELKRIYVPQPSADGTPWYINDQTIIYGPDNLWHMVGITHQEPSSPLSETMLAHATSPTLTAGNWTQLPPALVADPKFGETQLWAPYIIKVDNLYYMFYCGGGADEGHYQIELATSVDLTNWTRQPKPLFIDGYQARDPFVMRVNDQWVLYYTATTMPLSGGNHIVAYRTSTDLLQWSSASIAYMDPSTGGIGGPTESPFVFARNGGYYLFIGPRNEYSSTGAFFSKDPLHFDPSGAVPTAQMPTLLPTHATEIVTDLDGKVYVTHAGWGQGGLYLAPLTLPCP